MGLNDTPSGERIHIAFFGRRNAGKSSLMNAFTGQEIAVVSDKPGTTTDPVRKAMELIPLGPVMVVDTPGSDDEGEVGVLRVEKMKESLNRTDIAVLVIDASKGISDDDRELRASFEEKKLPYLTVYNKSDLLVEVPEDADREIYVSAFDKTDIERLKDKVAHLKDDLAEDKPLIGDLISRGDVIVLVVPIDKAAPKGRLILPQQQVIRDALDHGTVPVICRDSELKETLDSLKDTPRMVITDSQAFSRVAGIVPDEIPLTSFSILMARYKGELDINVKGAYALDKVGDGDRILISEGCTHHRQCDDIGTVKLPKWIREYTGREPDISYTSGREFPTELTDYKLVIHCGACMLNPAEVKHRYDVAKECGVPITNYGMAIAYMKGILDRSLKPFGGSFFDG